MSLSISGYDLPKDFIAILADPNSADVKSPWGNMLSTLGEWITKNQDELFKGTSLSTENRKMLVDSLLKVVQLISERRVDELKAEVDKLFKALDKQRKASGLQKFLKVLGVLAICLASVACIVNPTPATVIMLTISLALVLEPAISSAAGEKPLTEQAMKELVTSLSKKLGVTAGAVMGAMIFLVVGVALCYGTPAALSFFASRLANTASAAGKSASVTTTYLQRIKDLLKSLTNAPSPENQKIIRTVFNIVEAAVTTSTGALQLELARVLLQRDKYMHSSSKHKADADFTQTQIDDFGDLLKKLRDLYSQARTSSPLLFISHQ